jgi:hypothetical protein
MLCRQTKRQNKPPRRSSLVDASNKSVDGEQKAESGGFLKQKQFIILLWNICSKCTVLGAFGELAPRRNIMHESSLLFPPLASRCI